MHLNDPWFDRVRTGKKRFEGRRNTSKILQLKVGDTITFHHYTDSTREPVDVTVVDIIHYLTFREALKVLKMDEVLLPDLSIDEGCKIYERYVSIETQRRDGVVMIEIK